MQHDALPSRPPTRQRAAVAALAVVTFALVGCGVESTDPTTPSSSQSAGATPSSPTGPVGHYELVDDLCPHVNLDAISAVLPYVAEDLEPIDSPVDNAALCYGTLGISDNPDEQGGFSLYVEVFGEDSEAEEHFQTFYDVNASMSSAVDVDGIGQRAYQFAVPGAGAGTPSVRVLDGNAVITCEWYPYWTDDTPLPDGLFEAMTETIRSTMASLQATRTNDTRPAARSAGPSPAMTFSAERASSCSGHARPQSIRPLIKAESQCREPPRCAVVAAPAKSSQQRSRPTPHHQDEKELDSAYSWPNQQCR